MAKTATNRGKLSLSCGDHLANVQNIRAGNGASSFSGIRRARKVSWSDVVFANPDRRKTNAILTQLETLGLGSGYLVAFIVFPNLRSLAWYGGLVLGKLDHFTAQVTMHRPHLFLKEISNLKFDHSRHKAALCAGNMMIDSALMAFLLRECGHKTARRRSITTNEAVIPLQRMSG
jgi:hypothetical protein